MKTNWHSKILAMLLVIIMVVSMVPASVFAGTVNYDTSSVTDDYYKLISKKDWELAPGIHESEIVLNNDAGSHRQVAHVVEVDINNPYTRVIPSYKGMTPTPGNYGVQIMSEQVKYAEENGYGNVVAAMNISLSWYNSAYYAEHPELVGEPLGYMVLDGEMYVNSQGKTSGAQTCLVINFDEKDGVARPADMPKTEIRSTSSAITGWEEQVIPANFGFLVKNGVNQYAKDHTSDPASRSFIGVKEDGSIVMVMNDGRQSPYSVGFNNYEMAEFMISLGCVYASNGDGGGSSAFLSQRPGEEMKLNCSPSDGAERSTTHGILVISTAPSTGEFVRAQISTSDQYYTPNSAIQFEAIGTDLVGTTAAIPEDVQWVLVDDSFGTIDQNGLFTSNGKLGEVTAQLIYNGEVVGEATIEIVIPEISFKQETLVFPYGEAAELPINVTTNEGLNTVATKDGDIVYTLSDPALGTIVGNTFYPCDQSSGLTGGSITAVICGQTDKAITATIRFGKASEIVYDFEDGEFLYDADPEIEPAEGEPYGWAIMDSRKAGHLGYRFVGQKNSSPVGCDVPAKLYLVDKTNGLVRNGNYAMGVDIEWTRVTASCHAQMEIFLPEAIDLTDATSFGFWLYIPAEMVTASMQIRTCYFKKEGGTTAVTDKLADKMGANSGVFNGGWCYLSWDVLDNYKSVAYIEINSHYTAGEGNYNYYQNLTYYIDDITVDYSDATIDRENPYFTSMCVGDAYTESVEINGQTISSNTVDIMAQAYENTTKLNATGLNLTSAKLYVDGVLSDAPITVSVAGLIGVSGLYLNDGVHTLVMEISDNQGNVGNIVRKLVVNTEKSAVRLEVPEGNLLPTGSVHWVNLVADDLASIDSVTTTVTLDYVNAWELEGMEVAYGFEAEYYINKHNDAVITFTRTGTEIEDTDVLAKLPIRIWMAKGWMDTSGIRASLIFDDPTKQDKYMILTPHAMWYSDGTYDYRLVVGAEAGTVNYVDGSSISFSALDTVIRTEMNRYYTNSNRQNKWAFHICVAGEAQSKAPTCTESGYENRVYCVGCACGTLDNLGYECDNHGGCGSPIDWGTTIEATGHIYEVVDKQLVCACGAKITETGIFESNGKYYYAIAGTPQSGWQMYGEDWYYFGTDYAGYHGTHVVNGVEYEFENGRLVSGVWISDEVGTRYYYGPTYYVCKNGSSYANVLWAVIDGKTYGFDKQGYRHEGLRVLVESSQDAVLYEFTDEGVLVGVYNPGITGLFQCNGMLTYLKDGVPFAAGLIMIDGDYYYFNTGCIAVTGIYKVTRPNGLLPAGFYEFGPDGKMIMSENEGDDYVDPTAKNGPQTDGTFYLNDVRQLAYQIIEYKGNYYFIGDGNKFAVNQRLYLSARFTDGTVFAPGYYDFDEGGRMIFKHGPDADGFFYLYGVKQLAYQIVEFEGNYYFISDSNKLAVNKRLYLSERFTDGTIFTPGYYEFDAEGKMVIKNGPQADGYFYLNGVKQLAYQIVEFEGNYYFINDGNKYAVNKRLYLSARFTDGTIFTPGYYDFDADGKMIFKHGPQEDGYFYLNGVKQLAYQIVEFEGNYYFISDSNKLAVNKRLYLSERFTDGTIFTPGYYDFDAEGKMVFKHGPQEDGYFYLNGVKQLAYQIVEFEGNFYFIYDSNKYAVSRRLYLSERFTNGTKFAPGYYEFDAQGRMILTHGPQPDGFFYLNGVKQLAYQLIEFEGYYYFINNGNKYAKNTKIHLNDVFLKDTYLLPGYYEFDAQGRMIGHIHGIFNGRDLGDIPFMVTTDGRDIKSGLLIRGGELDNAQLNLPEERRQIGIDALKNIYNVKMDMDLRSPYIGGKDVLGEDVLHKYYNMVLYADAFDEKGKATIKEIFTDLANPDNYPIYLHCTHGADRAGTVSYILEAVLGVSEEYALREYLLSLRSYGNYILEVRDGLKAYGKSTLKECAEAYLLDCGITMEQIESIRSILLSN